MTSLELKGRNGQYHIGAWVSADLKAQIMELARAEGVSVSLLFKRAFDAYADTSTAPASLRGEVDTLKAQMAEVQRKLMD